MLTICPTPIGNLDDVTPRQRSALEEAEVVACEDTRRTGKLLERLGIDRSDGSPRLVPYHEHNEEEAAGRLVRALTSETDVVLVCDAGTPLISDPGFQLVRRAADEGIEIRSLPGASAALVALTASALPSHAFQFRGFPPENQEARRNVLRDVDTSEMSTIFYESPHRVRDLIEDVAEVYGEGRHVCVARELTKLHEEYVRGEASDVLGKLDPRDRIQGECTVVVAPSPEGEALDDEAVDRKIRELLERGKSPRTIREVVSELFDVSRSELYDRIEELRE